MEGQIQRDERFRPPVAEDAGGREPTAEEAAGEGDAVRGGVEGSPGKKLTGPAVRREAALRLIAKRGYSQRRACGLVEVDPKTVRRAPEPGDAEVRERLRSLAGERRRSAIGGLASCWSVRALA